MRDLVFIAFGIVYKLIKSTILNVNFFYLNPHFLLSNFIVRTILYYEPFVVDSLSKSNSSCYRQAL